ncbi:MAG: 50S ribosomal protein L21 [Acetilactobacillus jinshanensis]
MYAVILTGGKQYRVAKGDTVYVEKLNAKKGDKVTFKNVVFVGGKSVKIGTPTVSGASVEGSVVKQGVQKKVTLFRYKEKKGHHSKKGHRQPYTAVKISAIKA